MTESLNTPANKYPITPSDMAAPKSSEVPYSFFNAYNFKLSTMYISIIARKAINAIKPLFNAICRYKL